MPGFQLYNSDDVAYPAMARLYSQDVQVLLDATNNGTGAAESEGPIQPGTNAYTVKCAACQVDIAGTPVAVSAQDNKAIPAADATNPKWCYVEIDTSGVLQTNVGTAAASPEPPTPTANRCVRALVYIPANATTVDTDIANANGKAKILDRSVSIRGTNIQTFTTPGANTWVKPSGVTHVDVVCIAGGGGGGSGQRVAGNGTSAGGGGGGGPGGVSIVRGIPVANLGQTEQAYVGAAGTGGAAKTTTGNGNAGTNGEATAFGGLTTALCAAGGGGLGAAGIAAGGAGGAGGGGNVAGNPTVGRPQGGTWVVNGRSGGQGADATGGAAAIAGSQDQTGPGGGGGGGANTAGGTLRAAASGGNGTVLIGNAGAETAGGNAGTVGAAGAAGAGGAAGYANTGYGGGGGGGGGGQNGASGVGGAGGAGAVYGAGGGGGGNGVAANSGAGGDGAPGFVQVIAYRA